MSLADIDGTTPVVNVRRVLFVGGLSPDVDEQTLLNAFSPFGVVRTIFNALLNENTINVILD
jgi:RNA recognition motif-containing protein